MSWEILLAGALSSKGDLAGASLLGLLAPGSLLYNNRVRVMAKEQIGFGADNMHWTLGMCKPNIPSCILGIKELYIPTGSAPQFWKRFKNL